VDAVPRRGGRPGGEGGAVTTVTADDLVQEYLNRLEAELDGLPRARRHEIVGDIAEHIAAARADGEGATEADLRTLLDRLGEPSEIAAEARERAEDRPRAGRAGLYEITTIVLLLVGGFLFVVGWVVGVVLLWASDAWTTRDKLVGTLLVPGGLALPFVMLTFGLTTSSSETCTTEPTPLGAPPGPETCTSTDTGFSAGAAVGIAIFVVGVVGPIFTAIYLGRRMRRPAAAL
jgi:hypothetical protein